MLLPTDPQAFLAGQVLLINKPLTWTSFDVVNKVRYQLKRLLNIKKIKVGHAGTLDPLGDITQLPPMYSAVKMDGVPLYKLAREGKTKVRKPRPVEIFDFDLNADQLPEIGFRVHCSKGTYIRTLAYDFGKAVNSGAYRCITSCCSIPV